jgi:recombination protein RecT
MSIIAPPANGNQVTKRQPTVADCLRDPQFMKDVGQALPTHLPPDRFIRVALTATVKNPKLLQCTQASIVKCLMDCAAMGLEPDGRRAHLIPYDNSKKGADGEWTKVTECTLIIDYKGYVELVRRSSMVSKIHADIVCDGDVFEHNLGEIITHTYDLKAERDESGWFAVYAMVSFKDGGTQAVIMTKRQVLKIRDKSQGWIALQKGWAKQSPWKDNEEEMAKKTAFRRLTKWLTLSPEIVDAMQREDDAEARVIETTARPAIEAGGGNGRLAAMLAVPNESAEEPNDGGPTNADLAGTVDHSAETTKMVDPLPAILNGIAKAKTADAVDKIVAEEQAGGGHTPEVDRKIAEAGEARKATFKK